MVRPRYLEIKERLLAQVESEKDRRKCSPAHLLWRATKVYFPPWFEEMCAEVLELPKGRLATAEEIDLIDRWLTGEADRYIYEAGRYVLKDGKYTLRKIPGVDPGTYRATLVDVQAKSSWYRPDELFLRWEDYGEAFHEAAITLEILPLKRRIPSTAILETCQLCWQTGVRATNGEYFCQEHKPGSSKYKRQHLLRVWQAPHQPPDSHHSFVYLCWLELVKSVPNNLEPTDPSERLLIRLCQGKEIAIDSLPEHSIDWNLVWPKLKEARRYALKRLKSATDLCSAKHIIKVFDPLNQKKAKLHRNLHAAMARDQRHLLEMVLLAEAWLKARATCRPGGDQTEEKRVAEIPSAYLITLGGTLMRSEFRARETGPKDLYVHAAGEREDENRVDSKKK
jgi:hypothetical protein